MKLFSRYTAAVFALAMFPAVALAKFSGGAPGSASFSAVGPAGLKIEGKTSEVKVDQGGDNVVVTVTLGNLDTGIDLRNKHMREKYLEVGKYPTAELTVPRASLKIPDDGAEVSASTPGTLKLHGQTKPVTVSYKAKRDGDTYTISGSTNVKMTDYGIEQPSYLGVSVKPDVSVAVNFKAKDN